VPDYLRRGSKTDAVFHNAHTATKRTVTMVPGQRAIENLETVSVSDAKSAFVEAPRSKMERLQDGSYVFSVGSHWGIIHYTLLTRTA